VKVADLRKLNNISRRRKLKSGSKINLPENAVIEDTKSTKNSSSQKRMKDRRIASVKKKKSSVIE